MTDLQSFTLMMASAQVVETSDKLDWHVRLELRLSSYAAFPNHTPAFQAANSPIRGIYCISTLTLCDTNDQIFPGKLAVNSPSVNEQKINSVYGIKYGS